MEDNGCAWDEGTEINMLFDMHVRGLGSEAGRVQIASDRHDRREIQLPDCRARIRSKRSPDSELNSVPRVATIDPSGSGSGFPESGRIHTASSGAGKRGSRMVEREGHHEEVTLVADRLGQTQFGAQALESIADAIRTHESAGSDHGDDNDRDTRSPAGSHRAEVQLVAHHQVHVGQLGLDLRRRLARGSAREVVRYNRQFSLDVEGRQGGDLVAELRSTIRPGHDPTKEPLGR